MNYILLIKILSYSSIIITIFNWIHLLIIVNYISALKFPIFKYKFNFILSFIYFELNLIGCYYIILNIHIWMQLCILNVNNIYHFLL